MRCALSLLLAGSLLLAAPVPKFRPTMEEIYGEKIASDDECVAEMDKKGRLSLTIPTTATANYLSYSYLKPQIAKSIEGDFTLTARVRIEFPTGAVGRKHETAALHDGVAAAFAGLSVYQDDHPDFYGVNGGTVVIGDFGPKFDQLCAYSQQCYSGAGSQLSLEKLDKVKENEGVYVRASRKGKDVKVAYSADGKEWRETGTIHAQGKLLIGPVALGCADKEFTVTFDEYELKVGEK